MGDSNVYLDPGIYTYQLRYRTSRQLGFFDNQDELYWNVTGTGWAFDIHKAAARLTLPDTADTISLSGYTGPQGSTEQALDFSVASPLPTPDAVRQAMQVVFQNPDLLKLICHKS